jgi:hypothetical protein
MRLKSLLPFVSISLVVPAVAGVQPLSAPTENPDNHHVYVLLATATWAQSEAAAVAMGGHLATIRNQAEEDWVFKTFGSYGGQQRLLWIGLSDTAQKFHFAWSSGESVAYTRWAPGEPNNVGRGEDFVAIYYPNHDQASRWNDWNDRTSDPIGLPFNGVVEIIPPGIPSAAPTEPAAAVEISPTITITNNQGNIQLYWPLSATRYVLEATPDLTQPFALFGYSEATNSEAGTVTVTINHTADRMFFRLRKP